MVDDTQHRRAGAATGHTQVDLLGRLWPWLYIALVILLMSSGPLTDVAGAADRDRPIRIGALTTSWGPTPHIAGFRDGLLALGYHEHEDFVIGVRFTQGDYASLPGAARDLVRYGVDLIFASGGAATRAAQMATTQIPIVFAGQVSDPVGTGLVESFARPGNNITGVTDLNLELAPKRLQVFREIIPGLKRVLFPYAPTDALSVSAAKAYRDAARHLGIELVEQMVQTEEEAQTTLAQVEKGDVDGILAPSHPFLNIPGFILETVAQRGIPTMFDAAFWLERGGLTSYGADYYASGKQAARLVDKILKGADPGEIPVEVN